MSVFHNLKPYHHESYTRSPSVLSTSSSSSSPPPPAVYSTNIHGHIHFYASTMGSPMSGNTSPLSTISSNDNSSSAYNIQHLQISPNSNEYLMNSMSTKEDKPYLKITEQPINKFRFRYKSEMHGTHGMLTAQNSKKKFPTVCLHNFSGEALIRCSLYQIPKPGQDMPVPHSHSLVVRCGNADKKDPHEVFVSQLHGYQATFQGMGIIHTTRRFIEEGLFEKLVAKYEFECGHALTQQQYDAMRERAKQYSTDMNFNQVTLCFEAYKRIDDKWMQLCEPVFSKPINNLKSALHGELKISRISTVVGSANGNEDLFMFVEKVDKKNIKVRFYEQDENNRVIWEDWGKFTEADVHHQYAIALKTPSYRKTNIEKSVNVYIQLYRPGDSAISEPVDFRYKPSYNQTNDHNNRKRQRVSSFYDSNSPSVVEENTQYYHQAPDSYVPQQNVEMNNENDDSDDIEKLLANLDELNNLDFNAEDIESFLSSCKDYNEYDRLATDAVAAADADADDDWKLHKQTKEEKLVRQFLSIPLLKSHITDEFHFKIARKLCAYIFEQAIFNGDDTIIHICVKSDDFTLMDRLLDILHKFHLYELLNRRNYNGECCVHIASAMNKSNVLQKLIEFGANVNAADSNDNTALHVAIQNDNDDCVSTLLNSATTQTSTESVYQIIDIDLRVFNDFGYSPLHLASIKNNLNVVRMLNRKAAEKHGGCPIFDDVDQKHGNNALQMAIESDAYDVAEYLILNKCINPFKTNKSGHTALYLARVANATKLLNLMRKYTISNDEHKMCNGEDYPYNDDVDDDDDDTSSKDSFESQETNKTRSSVVKSTFEIDKLTIKQKPDEWKFDDHFYMKLSNMFNKNGKWKSIANLLGYQNFLADWQKSRSPTKVLFMFAESLKVSKDTLIEIFEELGEDRAIQCIHDWRHRCETNEI